MKWPTLAVTALLLVLGVGVAVRPGLPEAAAQPAKGGDGGRFSVSAFAGPNNFGAYVVDQSTGDVYFVDGDREPKKLGRVGK